MQQTLRANALDCWPSSFEDIKVLSLDCFDTLLWRKVSAPTDVFYALAKTPEFLAHGLTAPLRARAERNARQAARMTGQGSEVSLEQIYRCALPEAPEHDIAALVDREIAVEAQHCFVFKPVYDLIVRARAAGAKVIVVSDTYLSEPQLKRLLFSAMPELEGMLDAVYCSSTRGMSKSGGIWRVLIPLLRVPPASIQHLGDNEHADLISPQRFGIRSAHLVHQDAGTSEILYGREQAAVQALPEVRYGEPLPSPHHAIFASNLGDGALDTLGYVALGPIMHAFARFILDEARVHQSSMERGAVKLGFLLRDGYLPSKACAAFSGATVGSELNISRFTSIAATLDSKERVVALLSRMLTPDSLEPLTRQLQLPPEMASRVLRRAARSEDPVGEFAALVLQKETLSVIFAQSKVFRRRLIAHVQKVTGVQPGDTLMFVDLGYSGTAQTLLKDVLKKDLGVDLIGRYLICEHMTPHQSDRKGMIDAATQDGRIVGALTGQYIAGFEMLCAQNAPSTVGYTETGDPIFSSSSLGQEQHAAVAAIQSGCLRFISDERALAPAFKPFTSAHELTQCVAIDLARMLYFPSPLDVEGMRQFQFDFNLGTDKKLALFDTEAGLDDMRLLGFNYMNSGLDGLRTNYPTELRHLNLSLSVLLFAQNRFNFRMKPKLASYRKEVVPVLVARGQDRARHDIEAAATYDGFFALSIPISDTFDVAVMFGHVYSWVQLESVQMVESGKDAKGVDLVINDAVIPDQMALRDGGLFEVGDNGMLYIPANVAYAQPGTVCRMVFRPIAKAIV